jgi:hypothetical protein
LSILIACLIRSFIFLGFSINIIIFCTYAFRPY